MGSHKKTTLRDASMNELQKGQKEKIRTARMMILVEFGLVLAIVFAAAAIIQRSWS
jgi:hypothetical protein